VGAQAQVSTPLLSPPPPLRVFGTQEMPCQQAGLFGVVEGLVDPTVSPRALVPGTGYGECTASSQPAPDPFLLPLLGGPRWAVHSPHLPACLAVGFTSARTQGGSPWELYKLITHGELKSQPQTHPPGQGRVMGELLPAERRTYFTE